MVATNTRQKARNALAGKWKKGALITLIYCLITGLINHIGESVDNVPAIYFIIAIATFIISIPMGYGLISSFMKLKRGEEVDALDFLKVGFGNFARSWKIAFHIFLKLIIPVVLLVVCILIFVGLDLLSATDGFEWGYILGVVIYIAVLAYVTTQALLYYLAEYLALDNPEMSEKDAVLKSAELMRGHRGDLFVLQLSFIGWAIASIFTLFIGYFWLVPYMQVATVCFYEEIIEKESE